MKFFLGLFAGLMLSGAHLDPDATRVMALVILAVAILMTIGLGFSAWMLRKRRLAARAAKECRRLSCQGS